MTSIARAAECVASSDLQPNLYSRATNPTFILHSPFFIRQPFTRRVVGSLKLLAKDRTSCPRPIRPRAYCPEPSRPSNLGTCVQCAACCKATHAPGVWSRHLVIVAVLASQRSSSQLVHRCSLNQVMSSRVLRRRLVFGGPRCQPDARFRATSSSGEGTSTAMSTRFEVSNTDFIRSTVRKEPSSYSHLVLFISVIVIVSVLLVLRFPLAVLPSEQRQTRRIVQHDVSRAPLPSSVCPSTFGGPHVARLTGRPMAIHGQFSTERQLCVGSEEDGEPCVLALRCNDDARIVIVHSTTPTSSVTAFCGLSCADLFVRRVCGTGMRNSTVSPNGISSEWYVMSFAS